MAHLGNLQLGGLQPAVTVWRALRLGFAQRTSSAAAGRLLAKQQVMMTASPAGGAEEPCPAASCCRHCRLLPAFAGAADYTSAQSCPPVQFCSRARPVVTTAAAAQRESEAAGPAAPPAAALPGRELLLHNTMSRQKEVFRRRADQGNRVSMYVCGVTVYDYSHIGGYALMPNALPARTSLEMLICTRLRTVQPRWRGWARLPRCGCP